MSYNRELQKRYEMEKLAALANQESEAPKESDRAHLFTPRAGVGLPILQAIATGVFFGALATWAAWKLRSPDFGQWGLGVFLAIQSLAWLLLLWRWLGLTAPLERLTRLDINHDGHIGPAPVVRVEVKSEDGKSMQFADLPTTKAKMTDFARGVLAGTPISERHWSGAGALFSQNEFRTIRDIFLARGWLRWSNPEYPQQGAELSPAGKAVLRQFASEN